MLKSIKDLLETTNLTEHWLDVFAKSNNSEIPALEGKLKTIDSEIEQRKRRVQNLVARIADLPPEVPADGFYQQIQEWNQKVMELEHLRKELFSKSVGLRTQAIDKTALIEKLKKTVQRLDETPVEQRRPLYANLIEFAEIHPTKIRVGLNAPTFPFNSDEPEKRQYKATGTDGGPSGQNLNFKDCEPKDLSLVNRGGSTTVTIGAPCLTIIEPQSWSFARNLVLKLN